ncbi:PIN domain-containing protein [Candidatus Woesearchaeota archaeon]|nr:PIN domain-containing protein [Candidatus Woesearchaeota archaeon]
MNSPVYFFDTYAFFEIIRGNPNYKKYSEAQAITSIFNLAELNYNLKKEMSRKAADEVTERYEAFLVPVTIAEVKEAMDIKSKNRDLSIPDAIGYVVAKKYGVLFLTGDMGFKSMRNVEFVK